MEGKKIYLVLETNNQNLTKNFKNLKYSIEIDCNEKKISVIAGNVFFGGFKLDGNKIKLEILDSTEMLCMDEDLKAVEYFMSSFFTGEIKFEFQNDFIKFIKGVEIIICKVK